MFTQKFRKFAYHLLTFILSKSCRLLEDYCDVFIGCLDFHSDGTHSLLRIHWWASHVMLNFSKCISIKKQTQLHIRWLKGKSEAKWVNLEQIFPFGWTNPSTAVFVPFFLIIFVLFILLLREECAVHIYIFISSLFSAWCSQTVYHCSCISNFFLLKWSMKENFAISISRPLLQTHWVSGCYQSVSRVLGNFDDKLHGVFGLVAESPSNGIHCVQMCNTLEGLSVYRHQLESSLHTHTKTEISRNAQV